MRRFALALLALAAGAAAACGGAGSATTTPAAPAVGRAASAPDPALEAAVKVGLERLDAPEAAVLKGKRVGLIANGASVTSDGTPSARALRAHGIRVVRLFAAEHGLSGRLARGERVQGRADVVSLYEPGHRQPTRADLRGLDALVYDMQDAGVRFFTYVSTMIYAQRAAAAAGVTFVVLDRPNPLGGDLVAGPVADLPDTILSVAPGPLVHGLTAGEMARLVRQRSSPRGKLVVVPMEGWRRDMAWEDTGRRWVAPSPSLSSAQAALLYPGIALLEGTTASEGRGTGRAFRKLGAPWARVGPLLAAADVPGVQAVRSSFTPHPTRTGPNPKFNGRRCRGIALAVTGRGVDTFELGLRMLRALHSQPGFQWLLGGASIDTLVGTGRLRRALDRGASVASIVGSQQAGVAAWRRSRAPALLYG